MSELEKEARDFLFKNSHLYGKTEDQVTIYKIAHASGDVKGYQRCLDELAGKVGDYKLKIGEIGPMSKVEACEFTAQDVATPLLAQLAAKEEQLKKLDDQFGTVLNKNTDLGMQLAAKDKKIAELEQDGAQMSAYQCVHPESLTIREGQDGITCAKRERIAALEGLLLEVRSAHLRFNGGETFNSPFGELCELAAILAEKKEYGL